MTESESKINIAISGGPCTGKSTLAALLFAKLKIQGYDFDLVTEESRKLKRELGDIRSPFERLYLWRQQEREELRSSAKNGFISDSPLFHQYISARMHAEEPRDQLAVRELFRMCMEIDNRYQLIVMAQNPREFPYKTDASRSGGEVMAITRHNLLRSFVEHHWPQRLLLVTGSIEERSLQVEKRLQEMWQA